MAIVGIGLLVLGVYALLGVGFALWFVVDGVGRVSPKARGSGWVFRALILPGSAALWPVLVWELVISGGSGGVLIGRVVGPDDVETAALRADEGVGRYVDPDSETDVETDVETRA